ncbi:MAG: DUF4340 domain-containing protein [Acidobacteria bacterium]|nr:DUF4340 domain-containing protein [Acidobacteriota bacterium]
MNFKKILIIFAILVILAGIYYWDSSRKEQREQADLEADNISVISADSVEYVKIQRPDETYILKNAGDNSWVIRFDDGYTVAAESTAVISLLNAIGRIEKTEELGKVEDLSRYGLSMPSVSLTIGSEDKTQKINLGIKNPQGDGVYAQIGDQSRIFVVRDNILTQSDKSSSDMRNKAILNINVGDIASFTYASQKTSITFKNSDKEWFISSSRMIKADLERVTSFLNSLTQGEILKFIDNTKAADLKTGLENPVAELNINTVSGNTISLQFGASVPLDKISESTENSQQPSAPSGQIYLKSSTYREVLVAQSSLFLGLNTDINYWRNKKLLDIPFDSILDTTIQGPKESVSFKRVRETKFSIYKPSELPTSTWECNSLNNRITNLKALEIVENPSELKEQPDFDPPYSIVSIKTGPTKLLPAAENYEGSLIISNNVIKYQNTNVRFVKVNNIGKLYLVTAKAISDIVKTPFDLMDKSLVSIIAEDIDEIRIKTKIGAEDTIIKVERDSNTWKVSDPPSLKNKDVDDLVYDIVMVQMTGIAEKKSSIHDYGLDSPFAKISVIPKKGDAQEILIGNFVSVDKKKEIYLKLGSGRTVYTSPSKLRLIIEGLIAE